MANALYAPAVDAFVDGRLSWTKDDFRVMLVKAQYEFDPNHRTLEELGDVDNGRSPSLQAKTIIDRVADAGDTSLTAIAEEECNALIIFQQNLRKDAASRPVCYIDSPLFGLPFVPVASQRVEIAFDNGTNKIFRF